MGEFGRYPHKTAVFIIFMHVSTQNVSQWDKKYNKDCIDTTFQILQSYFFGGILYKTTLRYYIKYRKHETPLTSIYKCRVLPMVVYDLVPTGRSSIPGKQIPLFRFITAVSVSSRI